MKESKHSFVICAYKESAYLEECIKSLRAQTIKSSILVATSTPNQYIKDLCSKYNLPLYINEGQGGIAQDWNFAYHQCRTDYVTIAHQDDIYMKDYTEKVLKVMKDDTLIAFSSYGELRGEKIVTDNKNLKIKKILLSPLKCKAFQHSVWMRRRALSMGNPICCPAVTYVRKNLPDTLFHVHFRSNVDWETWESISRKKGNFAYVPEVLMAHRIHDESETSATIHENVRTGEDYEMFCRFWPACIAKLLTKVYASSEKSNDIDKVVQDK